MTEEIIIDGVNVAGCPYLYDKTDCSSHDCECVKCVHNSCFYKDMQRLKQENEKLRYKIQEAVQANDRIVAECAEIMKPKCETSMLSELMKENEKLKESLKMYQYSDQQHLLKVIAYENVLEEIREIAEPIYEDYRKRWDDFITEGLEEIIYKINEVLN